MRNFLHHAIRWWWHSVENSIDFYVYILSVSSNLLPMMRPYLCFLDIFQSASFVQAYPILWFYDLLSSLFSRPVPPTQAEYFLSASGEPPVKRERTANNEKTWNGTALVLYLSYRLVFKKWQLVASTLVQVHITCRFLDYGADYEYWNRIQQIVTYWFQVWELDWNI